jgi:HSP20 family molecular chaperone IbpA
VDVSSYALESGLYILVLELKARLVRIRDDEKVEAKREENQNDEDNFVRRERSYSCARTYYVGESIKEEDVKAKYNNGTLELFVPKKQKELPQKKNIQID